MAIRFERGRDTARSSTQDLNHSTAHAGARASARILLDVVSARLDRERDTNNAARPAATGEPNQVMRAGSSDTIHNIAAIDKMRRPTTVSSLTGMMTFM
jgi:hypothetical protein